MFYINNFSLRKRQRKSFLIFSHAFLILQSKMNDMLMGILRVRNLCSPPYVYTHPFTIHHTVSEKDEFIVMGSDGLFDFFSNDEVVQLVHVFIQHNSSGDPAKHLVEQLILKAADNAGISFPFVFIKLEVCIVIWIFSPLWCLSIFCFCEFSIPWLTSQIFCVCGCVLAGVFPLYWLYVISPLQGARFHVQQSTYTSK